MRQEAWKEAKRFNSFCVELFVDWLKRPNMCCRGERVKRAALNTICLRVQGETGTCQTMEKGPKVVFPRRVPE